MWVRSRFKTNSADPRPITFPPPGPWWHSGAGNDEKGSYSVVICFLPGNVLVKDYWPDARDVESEGGADVLVFTDRFPCPAWWRGEGSPEPMPVGTKFNPGPYDCYSKLYADEPYFLLRGKDETASELVRQWAQRAAAQGCPPEKVQVALRRADEMQAYHVKKVPD